MFAGQAPPFGWYWSASRSRDSAPSSTRDRRSPRRSRWDGWSRTRRVPAPRRSSVRRRRARRCRRRSRARRSARASRSRSARGSCSGACSKAVPGPRLEGLAQRPGDRVPGAVADLEQPLRGRAAAAGEPVAAALARELDAELLEPVDRRGRLAGQHLDQPPVGGLVRGAPDVLGVALGRVVGAEGRLDPALGLRGVVRLQRALRRDRDARAGAARRDTAAARPEAPLPTTSTSKSHAAGHLRQNTTDR